MEVTETCYLKTNDSNKENKIFGFISQTYNFFLSKKS